jgi:hypothetical protein
MERPQRQVLSRCRGSNASFAVPDSLKLGLSVGMRSSDGRSTRASTKRSVDPLPESLLRTMVNTSVGFDADPLRDPIVQGERKAEIGP